MEVNKTINEENMFVAGSDLGLQTDDNVSHAKLIDGESFMEIDVNKIQNNPMQPRLYIDESDLKDLMNSIKLYGLIQPISVISRR